MALTLESGVFLASRLTPPPVRPFWIDRPHLLSRLDAGLTPGCKLILLAAPPGCGKTTLLSQWIAQYVQRASTDGLRTPRCHWLTLDNGDNALSRFLAYLWQAMQIEQSRRADEGPLHEAQPSLHPRMQEAAQGLLTCVVNRMFAFDDPLIMVLDDYHLVHQSEVHDAVIFLVQNLPAHAHLVVGTRADPPLPLARLRAQNELLELRAEDLRFSPAETTALLGRNLGISLSEQDAVSLTNRTEGWAAGLHLVALSLAGQKDATHLVRSLSGANYHILSYLAEQVFTCQPEDIRSFLIQTAILERLCGPLCDAVTGETNGWAMLERLDHLNLFLFALDPERSWFRYHSLFRDFLLHWLQRYQPGLAPTLHSRASRWLGDHGLVVEALYHARAAGDDEQVRRLLGQDDEEVSEEYAIPAPIEPFTGRESEILHLMIQGLSNRQIADRLVLAVSTVKWYVNTIYGKLHVRNRKDAIARAYELHLDESLRV